uniref:Threonine aspartase 1 n=1 Tax=Anolis carolinensis TaxID=28377 RepID=G1K917_ANOCA
MIMEKGISSVEVLPSKSSHATTVRMMVKEHEAMQKVRQVGFVLVHAGAGYHSESKAKEYKHVCKRACRKAIEKLQAGALVTDAVTAALVELEVLTFIQAFSHLDAVFSVFVVSVFNTFLCFHCPFCFYFCSFLVGEGAFKWAVDHGIPACSPSIMATRLSLAAFKRNKRKLELAEKVETDLFQLKKRRQSSEKVSTHLERLLSPLSHGTLYGCGCWAENVGIQNPYSTAVSTSGCGEHLVRTLLARECSCALQNEDAHQALLETMQNKFISSPFLANEDGVLGGVIVLRSCRCPPESNSSQDKQPLLVEFLWSHTTESMCVGYMSAQDGKAKTHISRLPPGAVAGQSVAIEGGVCRLESPVS